MWIKNNEEINDMCTNKTKQYGNLLRAHRTVCAQPHIWLVQKKEEVEKKNTQNKKIESYMWCVCSMPNKNVHGLTVAYSHFKF